VLPTLNKMFELKGEKAVLDRAWVLERLMRNARIAMGEETVKLTLRKPNSRMGGEDGESATETLEVTDRDAQAANKALWRQKPAVWALAPRRIVLFQLAAHRAASGRSALCLLLFSLDSGALDEKCLTGVARQSDKGRPGARA